MNTSTYKPGPSIDEVLAKYAASDGDTAPEAETEEEPEAEPAQDEAANGDETAQDGSDEAEGEQGQAEATETTEAKPAEEMTPRERAVARRLEQQARELDERERRYRSEYEPIAKRFDELREKVVERPIDAFRDLLVDSLGVDEKEAERQIDKLVEERTRQKLGLVSDSDGTSGSDSGSLERLVLQTRKRQRADEERKRREAEEQKAQRQYEEAVAALDERLMQAQSTYPYLAVQDNPGRIILDLWNEHHQRTGTELSFEQAAAIANDHYKDKELRYYERRKSLFGQPQKPTDKQQHASEKSDERDTATPRKSRPRSLTHAAAATPATPAKDGMPSDPEAAKDWLLKRHLMSKLTKS